MREQVQICCQALRLGLQAEASSLLIPILESVTENLGTLPMATCSQVVECISRALDYQQTHNLIALADELEYVLLPMIDTTTEVDR